jgi:putative cardiolipin synthase
VRLRAALVCLAVTALALALAIVQAMNGLPSIARRSRSTAVPAGEDTKIGRAIAPQLAAHPGLSGIHALPDAREAFAARMLVAEHAERSLDIQYYIWRLDVSGQLLFAALARAAERGVRVRLLLDDHNSANLDGVLADLDAHEKIEVRLFNPAAIRGQRWLAYLVDFRRMNRRMHNKSFTADNRVTIVGGRNVGDEYFDIARDVAFVDLDVMAIGPVVQDVSEDFDRYWASESSQPVAALLPAGEFTGASSLRIPPGRKAVAAEYADVLHSAFVREILDGSRKPEWATARVVSDDPAKVLGRNAPETNLFPRLQSILGAPAAQLQLVSPYFVPTAQGVQWFTAAARRGVKIAVLTNSLEATDVPAVHAGYAKRRVALLKAGITVYEARREQDGARDRTGLAGSSDTSLHAKTFAVDGSRIFVGSFNFDPRSAHLNTELGFVIDSPAMAREIGAVFEREVPAAAYEVRLSRSGDLYWLERRGGGLLRHDVEPGTDFWQRAGVWLMSKLPIETFL